MIRMLLLEKRFCVYVAIKKNGPGEFVLQTFFKSALRRNTNSHWDLFQVVRKEKKLPVGEKMS